MSGQKQPILVAVIGIGLVGAEFVDQLLALPKGRFQLVSLSNSKSTVFSPGGLDARREDWQSAFDHLRKAADLADLAKELAALAHAGRNVVVVDNTSSDTVARMYPQFLAAGVHVVTPNKKAFSSDLALFEEIVHASAASGARYLNEATVGAGLPIVSTLKDLVETGDTVTKIEGVFSGTMSYIFNNFSTAAVGGPSFSSVVKIARDNGYTEPHPGDDLNGADVARKLTILARVLPQLSRSALPAGHASVDTRSLVPPALADAATGDDFMARLPAHDAEFETLRAEAHAAGRVLRYVGVVDVAAGVVRAALETYENTHAFATALGGADNIVMFHTKRYGARPLIVQGAGAGAAVTAMGVLSDLLKLEH